ncbi:MAG: gamma carbonic anhydrase family protein [Candidatus Odinarchaeia archaeon]
MTIIEFNGAKPVIHKTAYISKTARIIGDVVIGERVFIAPDVSVRGDLARIVINKNTVIEERTIIAPPESLVDETIEYGEIIIGEYVFIGRNSVIQGSYIGDYCFIGSNCVIEKKAQLNHSDVVLSGSVIPNNMSVPPQAVMVGNPARMLRTLEYGEIEKHESFIDAYLKRINELVSNKSE